MGEEAVEEAGELAAAFNLLLDPDFLDFGTCLGAIRNQKFKLAETGNAQASFTERVNW